jgi:predicted ATP-dependent serine protease
VVLHGAAGVGKSRLLSEALGRLTDRGTPVVHIVGSPVDAEIPLAQSRICCRMTSVTTIT